jgi:erythromycin esterase-like protein
MTYSDQMPKPLESKERRIGKRMRWGSNRHIKDHTKTSYIVQRAKDELGRKIVKNNGRDTK